jgi:hypothetical protein
MMVILTPSADVTGSVISITALGLEGSADYTVMLGDTEWFTGVAETDGSIGETAMVPTVPAGLYTVSLIEDETEITIETDFEVTHTTMISTNPSMAPNTYTVTVEGWYFSSDPVAVTFLLYNDTQEWLLGNLVNLNDDPDWDDGYFETTFDVPLDDEISLGTYTIKAEDADDLFAEVSFDVVEKTQTITPRKDTFLIGDTVSFNIETSFIVPDSYIEIYSPDGELYWTTDAFDSGVWVSVGTVNRVPYYYQTAGASLMVLLSDAPQGVYSWNFFDDEDEIVSEGTFNVDPSSDDVLTQKVEDLNNMITDLSGQVEDVSGEFDDVKSSIADVSALAQQAVNAANAATDAVNAVAQTANTASQAAADAAEAANAAKDAANGLTTLVYGAIGAALVAALAAIVSLMQISKRIAG